jgi:hypothetical protein
MLRPGELMPGFNVTKTVFSVGTYFLVFVKIMNYLPCHALIKVIELNYFRTGLASLALEVTTLAFLILHIVVSDLAVVLTFFPSTFSWLFQTST